MEALSTVRFQHAPPSLPLYLPTGMSDRQFVAFCRRNKGWRIERNALGEIEIMAPAGSGSGRRNFVLGALFAPYEIEDGRGLFFDSSAGFKLPNGATRSPDIAWIEWERWEAVGSDQQEEFAPICPDFVLELRSPSDDLDRLKEKMEEWITNGVRLGWLLDPSDRSVYRYESGKEVVKLDNPETVAGEPVLTGFILDVRKVWNSLRRPE